MERASFPTPEGGWYDIRIDRDGTWYYRGTPIRRMELVKLFSTVLRRDEAGGYWLVTPAERGRIAVEDAPFVAVALDARGEGQGRRLVFRTNLDKEVTAGPDHPIRVSTDPDTGEPRPYIRVGDGIEARIARPVFYELAALCEEREEHGEVRLGVWSMGTFFVLGSASEP